MPVRLFSLTRFSQSPESQTVPLYGVRTDPTSVPRYARPYVVCTVIVPWMPSLIQFLLRQDVRRFFLGIFTDTFLVPRSTLPSTYFQWDTDGDIIPFMICVRQQSCDSVQTYVKTLNKKSSLHAECDIDIQFVVRL